MLVLEQRAFHGVVLQKSVPATGSVQFGGQGVVEFRQRFGRNAALRVGHEAGQQLGGLDGLSKGSDAYGEIGQRQRRRFDPRLAGAEQEKAAQGYEQRTQGRDSHQSRLPLVLGTWARVRRVA